MTAANELEIVERRAPSELLDRLRSVSGPRPVLEREREHRLTDRQREILDQLGTLFDAGFAHLTMATIAARANCSLRTLYSLAPSRDEVVLVVVDRNLWRVGRTAMSAITPDMGPLDALQAYLGAATEAVEGMTAPFARDLALMPAARRLSTSHEDYTEAITRTLLDLAVEQGEIPALDTPATARIMASLATTLSRPEVIPTLRSTPKKATEALVAIMIRGMRTAAGSPIPVDRRTSEGDHD